MSYRIKKYIQQLKNYVIYLKDSIFPYNNNLKSGLSFLVRAKNEEENIIACIESIIGIADEIIIVDNNSTDKTPQLALELSKKYPDTVSFFKFNYELPLVGEPHKKAVLSGSNNTITAFYNWTLMQATYNNIVKWDADFIAIRDNLKKLIQKYRIKERKDKFAVFFSGETLFIDYNRNTYLKKTPYYQEYRVFSKRNGFKWVHNKKMYCEVYDPNYIKTAFRKYISDLPCFYEIKRISKNEFSSRSDLLDKRDYEDYEIISDLKNYKVNSLILPFNVLNDENFKNLKF